MFAVFANNAMGKLGGDITTSSTTLILQTGNGILFPSPTGGNYFPITVMKSDGTLEIMKCTARTSDTFTVTRSQEGTTAKAFSIGDRVSLRMTAGSLTDFVSDKQPLDATLTALAGVTVAADKIIYATAADTFATTTLTAFIRTILDDATASDVLTTLGMSAFIKTLLGDADAATARATIGALSTDEAAASAKKLATAITINGVSFDGKAAITAEPYIGINATAATRYLTFVDSITAGFQRLNMNSGLTYNPSTNLLNAVVTSDISDVGKVCAFARKSAPSGYLKCNGAAISRTTYATLFAAIGTTFGAGDGSTTFNVPDLRGEHIRGWDDARGIDTGRALGSWQDNQNLSHTHTATVTGGSHTHSWSGTTSSNSHSHTYTTKNNLLSPALGSGPVSTWNSTTTGTTSSYEHAHTVSGTTGADAHTHTVTNNGSGGAELRVRNVALLYCIKY